MRRRLFASTLLVLALAPVAVGAAGCSSDSRDKAKDAAESAKDDVASAADEASARGIAEALRASLKADKRGDTDGLRSVDVINENVADLPGDPAVSGVEDGDGDGKDDDGKVQVEVDGKFACVTIPASGEDTKVASGAC